MADDPDEWWHEMLKIDFKRSMDAEEVLGALDTVLRALGRKNYVEWPRLDVASVLVVGGLQNGEQRFGGGAVKAFVEHSDANQFMEKKFGAALVLDQQLRLPRGSVAALRLVPYDGCAWPPPPHIIVAMSFFLFAYVRAHPNVRALVATDRTAAVGLGQFVSIARATKKGAALPKMPPTDAPIPVDEWKYTKALGKFVTVWQKYKLLEDEIVPWAEEAAELAEHDMPPTPMPAVARHVQRSVELIVRAVTAPRETQQVGFGGWRKPCRKLWLSSAMSFAQVSQALNTGGMTHCVIVAREWDVAKFNRGKRPKFSKPGSYARFACDSASPPDVLFRLEHLVGVFDELIAKFGAAPGGKLVGITGEDNYLAMFFACFCVYVNPRLPFEKVVELTEEHTDVPMTPINETDEQTEQRAAVVGRFIEENRARAVAFFSPNTEPRPQFAVVSNSAADVDDIVLGRFYTSEHAHAFVNMALMMIGADLKVEGPDAD